MPQLIGITTITARLEVLTGLRIGAGDSEMHIGGIDNTVVKHPHTLEPYLPGSSIKGKMRSLLEWRSGAVKSAALTWRDYQGAKPEHKAEVLRILQLFGTSGDAELGTENGLGPTRLSFWDCKLGTEWVTQAKDNNNLLTEVKSENRIDRISGTAEHPRQTERVPAGAWFDFTLSIKTLDGDGDDLLNTVLAGLKLIELDSLGGSGSRGYGKVQFTEMCINKKDHQANFDAIKPFGG